MKTDSLCLIAYATVTKLTSFLRRNYVFLHGFTIIFAEFNPLTDYKILDWSKLKQIADGILKCIWNEK